MMMLSNAFLSFRSVNCFSISFYHKIRKCEKSLKRLMVKLPKGLFLESKRSYELEVVLEIKVVIKMFKPRQIG